MNKPFSPPSNTILTDCDDVLLDWIGGFAAFLRSEGYKHIDAADSHDWDMSKWIGASAQRTQDFVLAFNEESEAFGKLVPKAGAQEYVARLIESGKELVVITSCSAAESCIRRRHQNLTEVFGNVFKSIHCVPLGTSKAAYLQRHAPSFWIEDNYQNALMGREIGHKPIIMRTNQNKAFEADSPEDVLWVDHWSEIEEHIVGPVPAYASLQ